MPDGAALVELDVFYFKRPGVALSMYNVDEVYVAISKSVEFIALFSFECFINICYFLIVYQGFC